jgi:dihydrodipicolinate synthase/N-acetylneuraminate lyase
LPVFAGTFRTQGAILTKAALTLMGLPGGHTRLPLVDATDAFESSKAFVEDTKKEVEEVKNKIKSIKK